MRDPRPDMLRRGSLAWSDRAMGAWMTSLLAPYPKRYEINPSKDAYDRRKADHDAKLARAARIGNVRVHTHALKEQVAAAFYDATRAGVVLGVADPAGLFAHWMSVWHRGATRVLRRGDR